VLADLLDRLGQHEAAATIAGFAFSPMTTEVFPEITTAIAHLRDVLGDQTYESLARKGETMSTTAMATYAYDQIDQARIDLDAVSQDDIRDSRPSIGGHRFARVVVSQKSASQVHN
jgi:hypothetical protein